MPTDYTSAKKPDKPGPENWQFYYLYKLNKLFNLSSFAHHCKVEVIITQISDGCYKS